VNTTTNAKGIKAIAKTAITATLLVTVAITGFAMGGVMVSQHR